MWSESEVRMDKTNGPLKYQFILDENQRMVRTSRNQSVDQRILSEFRLWATSVSNVLSDVGGGPGNLSRSVKEAHRYRFWVLAQVIN